MPQVSDSDYKRLTTYTLDDGDIVFSRVGSVDINALITPFQSNWLFSGRVLRVRPQTDISSKFLHTRLETESIKTDIRTRAVGQTMPSINTEILKITPLVLPSSAAEQEQIGSYFAALDNLITLHQRQPFLHSTPEISLTVQLIHPFYTSSWEQRKLGELVDVCSGRDYKHLSEGTIPVYGTGGYMLSVNDALSYDRDAIGIGRKGTIDRPYIVKAPFWTVDTLFYAIPREKVDLNYAFDIFQNIDWKKKDESTGVPSLSKTAINDIDVLAPKHDEQQIIGQFFAAIDNLITLHQRKGKAAVTGCSNDANNSKGVYCKARDFGYKCYKKVKSQQIRCLIAVFIFFV